MFNKFWQETTNNLHKTKDFLVENQSEMTNQIREWIVSLFSKAIASFSNEQDRLDAISWLAFIREIIENPSYTLPLTRKKPSKLYLIAS